jgi:hypothetical protein
LGVVDVADSGMNTLIKVGLIGGAAYLVYKQGWLAQLGIGAPAPAAAQPSTGVPAPGPVGYNTLDAIYGRMVTAAAAPSAGYNADQWNYFLAQVSNITPPDVMDVFSSVPGFDRSKNLMSAMEYWAVMAPYLKSKMGLSGLGIFGGLAGYVMCGGRC